MYDEKKKSVNSQEQKSYHNEKSKDPKYKILFWKISFMLVVPGVHLLH